MTDEDDELTHEPTPRARVMTRRPLQLIWVIPIVAALVAAFLGYRAIAERGPMITLTFRTGDGLTAGQTKVRHKAVELGTVESINLSRDMKTVEVRVQMRREASAELTDHARFWVVRARLNAGSISGLDTLVSGAFIELDPGDPQGAEKKTEFTGLEEPPAVRSDEPGQTFTLKADRIGSLSSGSPVFYRDITVGEVLGYDLGPNGDGVTIHTFIRDPYDKLVHDGTHFWNASGLQVDLGAQGVQLRVESLQAVISGGVAFDTVGDAIATAAAKDGSDFQLFSDENAANNAGYKQRIPFIVYFEGSVRGLAVGSPVELYGIQIGNVTDIKLQFDPSGDTSRVAVRLEVTPERIAGAAPMPQMRPIEVARTLVRRGLRVSLTTANYLTGQMVVAMDFFPNTATADVQQDGDAIVLPSEAAGGIGGITASLSAVADKISRLPLDQIARNLNDTLRNVSQLTNSPELKQTLTSMSATMSSAQDLVKKVDSGTSPLLKRLPDIAASLQATVERANRLVGSADSGYGANSEFRRDIERLLGQVSDTARSVRLLADYLDQHPEALIRGRTDRAGER